jgi:hypothetical protein
MDFDPEPRIDGNGLVGAPVAGPPGIQWSSLNTHYFCQKN